MRVSNLTRPPHLAAHPRRRGGSLGRRGPARRCASQPWRARSLSVAASLAAAVLYALGGVYARRAFPEDPPLTVALGQQVAATLLMVPATIATLVLSPPSAPVTQATVMAVIALGVGATAGGYLLYFWIIRTAGPLAASTVTFIVPLAGAGLGVQWLDEPVTAGIVFGLVAIIMGGVAGPAKPTSSGWSGRFAIGFGRHRATPRGQPRRTLGLLLAFESKAPCRVFVPDPRRRDRGVVAFGAHIVLGAGIRGLGASLVLVRRRWRRDPAARAAAPVATRWPAAGSPPRARLMQARGPHVQRPAGIGPPARCW